MTTTKNLPLIREWFAQVDAGLQRGRQRAFLKMNLTPDSKPDILVRLAEMPDADRLWELAQLAHQESRFADQPMDFSKVFSHLLRCVNDPRNFLFLVVEIKGQIVGLLTAYIAPYWFNDRQASYDLLLFVTPEFRSTSAAPRLINAYVTAVRAVGVKDIYLGTNFGPRNDLVGQLYERLGFERTGGLYLYNPDVRRRNTPSSSSNS